MFRTLMILVLLFQMPGCYRYAPVRMDHAPVGAEVRLELTEEGSLQAEHVLGRSATSLTGELREWSGRVVVAVDVPPTSGGVNRSLRQVVVLRSSDVISLGLREHDRIRTTLLITGIAAAVVGGAIAALTGTFGGNSRGLPSEQPEGFLIPLRPRMP